MPGPQQRKTPRGAGIVRDWPPLAKSRAGPGANPPCRPAAVSAVSMPQVVHSTGAPPCGQVPEQVRQGAPALALQALPKKQADSKNRRSAARKPPACGQSKASPAPETIAAGAGCAWAGGHFYPWCAFLDRLAAGCGGRSTAAWHRQGFSLIPEACGQFCGQPWEQVPASRASKGLQHGAVFLGSPAFPYSLQPGNGRPWRGKGSTTTWQQRGAGMQCTARLLA